MPLRIEFQYSFEEYKHGLKQLNMLMLKSSGSRRFRSGMFGWILLVGLAVLVVRFTNVAHPTADSDGGNARDVEATGFISMLLAIAATLLIVGFVLYVVFAMSVRRKQFDADRAMNQLQVMTFDDDAFHLKTYTSESTMKWNAFVRVENTPQFLFLFLRPNQAFMLPARAFPDANAFNATVEMSRARVSAHGQAFPVLPVKTGGDAPT